MVMPIVYSDAAKGILPFQGHTGPSGRTARMISLRPLEDHINISISHSASVAQCKLGYQKPWFVEPD